LGCVVWWDWVGTCGREGSKWKVWTVELNRSTQDPRAATHSEPIQPRTPPPPTPHPANKPTNQPTKPNTHTQSPTHTRTRTLGDRLEHLRALDFHGHKLLRALQPSLVHLCFLFVLFWFGSVRISLGVILVRIGLGFYFVLVRIGLGESWGLLVVCVCVFFCSSFNMVFGLVALCLCRGCFCSLVVFIYCIDYTYLC
jgi:hypothetical protein